MDEIPVWVQALTAIVAAFGGVGTFLQLAKWYQSWRAGVRQREDEREDKLIDRLEKDIEILKIQTRADARYIRRLVMALGRAGIEIPPHPDEDPLQPS